MATPLITTPATLADTANNPVALGATLTDANQPHAGTCALTVTCSNGTLSANGIAIAGTINDTFAVCQSTVAALTYTGLTAGTDTIHFDFWNQLGMNVGASTAVTVTASTAPNAPTAPAATNVGQTSLTLGWSKSTAGSAPIGYQVSYRVHGASQWTDSPIVSQWLTGLTPGTTYDFQITAVNQQGKASSSIITATTATAGAPVRGDATGVTALRLADFLEFQGYGTFSGPDANTNAWGAWPADYSKESVEVAYAWLTGGNTVNAPQTRENCYNDGRATLQATWCPAVSAASGTRFQLAVGGGGDASMVPALKTLAQGSNSGTKWLRRVEGCNEPNTDFGSGDLPVTTAIAVQQALNTAVVGLGVDVCGPSIVAGTPYPEGYVVTPYATAAQMAQINAACTIGNAHLYPGTQVDQDDGSTRGGIMRDYIAGMKALYNNYPIVITEWHPTLFNAEGHNNVSAYDAYYAMTFLLSAFRQGVLACFWYSLFDYGQIPGTTTPEYICGVFPQTGGVNPRPVAYTLQAQYKLTGDSDPTRYTFTPDKLAYTISGLPTPLAGLPDTGGQHMLMERADGTFYLWIWNSQKTPGGAGVPIVVSFTSHAMASVKAYKVTDVSSTTAPTTVIFTGTAVSSVPLSLDASVILLVIKY